MFKIIIEILKGLFGFVVAIAGLLVWIGIIYIYFEDDITPAYGALLLAGIMIGGGGYLFWESIK